VATTEDLLTGAEVVHLAIPDTGGTLRSKRFPRARAAKLAAGGWSFIEAIQWWDTADGVPGDRAWTHAPAEVDLQSVRRFPFEPGAAIALADFTGATGALSPRRVLARLTERLAALGLTAKLAFEIEVILLDGTSDDQAAGEYARPRAIAAANRCWSGLTMASHADLIRSLDETLAAGDVVLDHLCAELGPGCLELATTPNAPVAAADDLAFLKLYTKAWAFSRGRTATFMAKLSEDFPGLGGHPVLSLHDAETGADVLAGGDVLAGSDVLASGVPAGGSLSKAALHAIAGIVAALPELTIFAAPTVNSYRRLAPGNWAPRTATWGIGNYTCGLRAVPAHAGTPARLELRLPGADANPWLAAALAVGGAVHGLEQRLEAPPPVAGPAREVPPGLPRTLLEAAERLAASDLARDLAGEEFVSHYAATRAEEDRQLRLLVPAAERARYLDHA
jgi:glutamine synthetase